MKRILIVMTVLSLMAAVPAHAVPGVGAGARGMYGFPDLTGMEQRFDPVIGGTEFNIKDDVGIGDEDVPSGEAFLRFSRVTFRLKGPYVGAQLSF